MLYMIGIKERHQIYLDMQTTWAVITHSVSIWYDDSVSRNRLDDTEFLSVSIQEGIQPGFIVSNFFLLTLDDITVAFIYNPTCSYTCKINSE